MEMETAMLTMALLLFGSAQAQVLFNEQFTGGASTTGFTLNQLIGTTTWSYNDPGGRGITGAGFDADFAIYDSDFAGSGGGDGSAALISAAFDASVPGLYSLTFDESYRVCCGSTADVEVFDGTVWNNVLAHTSSSSGWPTALTQTIDITAAAGGSAVAQVRFIYHGDWDYWWALDNIAVTRSALPACPDPSTLTATNLTTSGADLGWTEIGSATAWDIEVGPGGFTPTGTPTFNDVGNPYTYAGGSPNTTYDFYVRADCGMDNVDVSSWVGPKSFFTGYCTPAPTSVDGSGITNVTFSTVNNPTGAEPGNYGDYSAMVGDIAQSTTAYVDITFSTGYTYETKIWVDWNDDLDFDDIGEEVYSGVSTNANPTH